MRPAASGRNETILYAGSISDPRLQSAPDVVAVLKVSAILPRVEYSKNEDVLIGQFIANFVVANQQAAHLARRKLSQADTEARMYWNSLYTGDELSHDSGSRNSVNGVQEFVEPYQIGVRLARPA